MKKLIMSVICGCFFISSVGIVMASSLAEPQVAPNGKDVIIPEFLINAVENRTDEVKGVRHDLKGTAHKVVMTQQADGDWIAKGSACTDFHPKVKDKDGKWHWAPLEEVWEFNDYEDWDPEVDPEFIKWRGPGKPCLNVCNK